MDQFGNASVTLEGSASVDSDGLHVDGADSKAIIANWDYASDGSFTIGYWFQKEECTAGPWEYIYSHANTNNCNIFQCANINTALGCRVGFGDTFHRSILVDDAGSFMTYDYFLHDAGSFDAITAVWIHYVFAQYRTSLGVYVDGVQVPDEVTSFSSNQNLVTADSPWPPHPT